MEDMEACRGMLIVETIVKIHRAYFVQQKPIKEICREHVRLCHSRMLFVRAYPRESQEMVFAPTAPPRACRSVADEGTARHARVPSMADLDDKSSPAQRGPFSTPIRGPNLKPIDTLRPTFEGWFPGLAANDDARGEQAAA